HRIYRSGRRYSRSCALIEYPSAACGFTSLRTGTMGRPLRGHGTKKIAAAQGTATSKNPSPLRGQLLFLLQFSPKRMAWTRVINEARTRQSSRSQRSVMREMSELHAEIHTIQNLLPVYAKRYHGQHIAGPLVIFWVWSPVRC